MYIRYMGRKENYSYSRLSKLLNIKRCRVIQTFIENMRSKYRCYIFDIRSMRAEAYHMA